jgi:peptidoglycan hydrolase-like amidase
VPNSGALRPSHELCTYNDINNPDSYGCGSKLAGTGNQEPQGFFNVLVEQDYLPDVLATEMNLAQIPPHIEALKAQAVASRTVASWKTYWSRWTVETVNGYEINTINNSTQYQVFIPGAYDPSSATQADVGTAVSATHGQYLSGGDGHTIDAEFGADMEVQT